MTGSVQESAIDDSFEGLTNAPDAWVSGPEFTPRPVDYQHFVELGDERSAVDDRCFTEYGVAGIPSAQQHERSAHAARTTHPGHRSRRPSSKSSSRGKRRPSPSFTIRSKDGQSVVRNNPFVLRRSTRSCSREPASNSDNDDSESVNQHSVRSSKSHAFKIRIKGKNGEEVVQDIRRPLVFTSSTVSRSGPGETTAVASESDYPARYQNPGSQKKHSKRDHNDRYRKPRGNSHCKHGKDVNRSLLIRIAQQSSKISSTKGAIPPCQTLKVARSGCPEHCHRQTQSVLPTHRGLAYCLLQSLRDLLITLPST